MSRRLSLAKPLFLTTVGFAACLTLPPFFDDAMRENEPVRNAKSKVVVGGSIVGVLFFIAIVIKKSGWLESHQHKHSPSAAADGKQIGFRPPVVSPKRTEPMSAPVAVVTGGRPGLVQTPREPAVEPVKVMDLDSARAVIGVARKVFRDGGLSADFKFDIAVLRESALKGNRLHAMQLGYAYADGRGVIKDEVEAAKWLQVAMDRYIAELERSGFAGDIDAILRLVRLNAKGLGTSQNARLAEAWVTFAISVVPPEQLLSIAGIIQLDLDGDSLARQLATKVIVAGAIKGLPEAQYAAGLRFESSQGTDRNLAEAYAWFNLAAAQGHLDSLNRRETLEKSAEGHSIAEQGQRRARQLVVEIEKASKQSQDKAATRLEYVKLLKDIKAGNK